MGWLPYSGGSATSWFSAFAGSALVHGGLLALAVFVGTANGEVQEQEEEDGFVILFGEIESSMLEDVLAEEATANLDSVEPVEEPETVPPEELTPEETPPEEVPVEEVEPEEITPEEPPVEEIAPEDPPAEEPETPEIEEVEPEAPEVEEIAEIPAEDLPVEEVAEALPELEEAEEVVAEEVAADLPPEEVIAAVDPAALEPARDPYGGDYGDVPAGTADLAPVEAAEAVTAAEPVGTLAPVIEEATPFASIEDDLSPIINDGGGGGGDVVGPIVDEIVSIGPVGGGGTPPAVGPIEDEAATVISVAPIEEDPAEIIAAANETSTPETPRPEAEEVEEPAAPEISARDRALGDLIRRIRASDHPSCLLALPQRAGEDGIALAMVSDNAGLMQGFAEALLDRPEDADILQARTLVDSRQCAALDFILLSPDYPATGLGLRIDTPEVASGEAVTGAIRGAAGRFLTVLLVDDNGVVQDLGRFLTTSGATTTFEVPVTRVGDPRPTRQMLIALATTAPPREIQEREGLLAAEVFEGLTADDLAGAAIAVGTFDVR